MTGADPELERATLALINMVAYSASSHTHARRFREATGLELSTSDIRLLEHLAGREPVATGSLANALGIDITQASRQVAQLAAAGHVERATDARDRRRTLVTLTPGSSRSLDEWLATWAAGYGLAVRGWPTDAVDDLAAWLRHAHECLAAALPHRPSSTAAQRWLTLTGGSGRSRAHNRFVMTVVDLVAWVAQSGGFNDLLEAHRAPIRQHAYFTLRVVSRHGPLSVAEVAEQMGIDHSQASKRLTQLVELELVDRSADLRDRRTSVVRATRRGANLERRIRSAQLQDFAGILGEMSSSQRARWTDLMRQYTAALLAADDRPADISP